MQKMAQNDRKLCPPRLTSQESCIMLYSFMVHMFKMMISPGIFFILIFLVVSGVKDQKLAQNDIRTLVVSLHISGTVHRNNVIFGTNV